MSSLTYSIALHILIFQARQQNHERDMKLLEIKVQQEKKEVTKIEQQMDEAKQRSKEAAQDAKDVMMRVQGDGKEDKPTNKYTSSNKLDNSDNIRPKRGSKQVYYTYMYYNIHQYSQTCPMWPKGTVKYGHIRQVVA